MNQIDKVKQEVELQLQKSLEYLAYSYKKVQSLPSKQKNFDPEILETWESFAARFSRVADIYLSKYLKLLILREDPGFRGSFRDMLNQAEKLNFIDDVQRWLTIRALRNLTVHEYANEDMSEYFLKLVELTPFLLNIKI